MKSAFAVVLREFALHDSSTLTDSQICSVFVRFGFEKAAFDEFLKTYKDRSALEQAGVPKSLSDQIAPISLIRFFVLMILRNVLCTKVVLVPGLLLLT